MDFEYIRSTGAHGHHHVGVFDAFVGSEREIWIGSDGSGLIREASGPAAFFTEDGRSRWEAAGSPQLEHPAGVDLFAPGCLGGSRSRRARLQSGREPARALHEHVSSLRSVASLIGEAVTEPTFCQSAWKIVSSLDGVEVIPDLADQIGRAGPGLARVEGIRRVELIFSPDHGELLAYQHFLSEAQEFAPAGTLHSWTAYLERKLVDRLPEGIPPIPNLPCEAGPAGRAFRIRPGLHIMTGYTEDAAGQLRSLHEQNVITADDYRQALNDLR